MKALVLAGGFGTRLRPLTLTRPKHMLPIANRPHVEHVFDLLSRHGIEEVALLMSYLPDAFHEVIERARTAGTSVATTLEREPLGTAGAIKNAEAVVGDETFFVFNGDILTDADLNSIVDFHRRRRAQATIVLYPVEDPSIYGVVPTDSDGRVLGFVEKPPRAEAPTNLINAGIYVFEPSVLARIPPGEVWSAETQLFPGLVAEGARLYACPLDGYWMDIGTPAKYVQANVDALTGHFGDPAGLGASQNLVDSTATIDDGADVSLSCLGPGARVGAGADVQRSVLLSGAVVESGARVNRSVIGAGACVRAGARVQEGAIADGEVVESDQAPDR